MTGPSLAALSHAVHRSAAVLQRDLGQGTADAYHGHQLLLALRNRWDAAGPGASSPLGLATQRAIVG